MMDDLDGLTVAVLGGDARERFVVERLLRERAQVRLAGYGAPSDVGELAAAHFCDDVVQAVTGADAVVAPMSNTDAAGRIQKTPDPAAVLLLDDAAFGAMRPGTPLLIGLAKPAVRERAEARGVLIVETAEIDAVAIPNSIPTAEGAVAKAMAELDVTIHKSQAIVLGFGRCAQTLVRVLVGLGAHVRVFARSAGQRARADEMRASAHPLAALPDLIGAADVIFNTIPAPVLPAELLPKVSERAVIIDIASAPGGVDFAAARALGRRAFHELSLPGRVAPATAGAILADAIPELIRQFALSRRDTRSTA